MEDFFRSIPAAASSPYAFAAYAIAAILFLFAGAKLRLAKMLLDKITAIPPKERRRALEIATGTVLPTHIEPEQWIRNNRTRWIFLLLAALLIVILVIATITIVNPTATALNDIKVKLSSAEFASLRGNYPLEPLELEFTIEYSMDQPQIRGYAERLRGDIVSYLRKARENRRQTSESLTDEKVLFVVSNQPEWQPRMTDTERLARQLLEDNTEFHFRKHGASRDNDLRLLSTSRGIADAIVTMKHHGEISQKIKLCADFSRRVFVKSVLCRSPVRTGSDVTSVSSLDLVGRELTWAQAVSSELSWVLVSFAMRFSYDYGFGQEGGGLPSGRELKILRKQAAEISIDHIGLRDVLNSR